MGSFTVCPLTVRKREFLSLLGEEGHTLLKNYDEVLEMRHLSDTISLKTWRIPYLKEKSLRRETIFLFRLSFPSTE
jgi:hypothetical protein